jgi:integrase
MQFQGAFHEVEPEGKADMKSPSLPVGTRIACDVRDSSTCSMLEVQSLTTIGGLLDILSKNPPRAFSMLRTTCSMLGTYLETPATQVPIDSIHKNKDGFRPFLQNRKYAENSIRTYVNHLRILLKIAREFGWKPSEEVPQAWRDVLSAAAYNKCEDIAKHLAEMRKMPRDVTIEDVDSWVQMKVQQGASYRHARTKKTWFWRILLDGGYTKHTPDFILREKDYGIPIGQLPLGLRAEVNELMRWKQAAYSSGRPKDGRHRAVTSNNLRQLVCGLIGFAINIYCEAEITSLSEVVRERIVGAYAEFCVNERKVRGGSLQHNLRLLSATMQQHPGYKSMDFSWFKPLMDGLPVEPKSELKKRKSEKYLEYTVVESIPARIHAERPAAQKKGVSHVARLVMEELLMKWLITLPWRQRNIRECRVGGASPNLFKGKIPHFSDLDKPNWVIQEELKNPTAEFWQFRFSPDETKTEIEVNSLLPRQLIGLLEEYLRDFRHHLLRADDPETLVVNRAGKQMTRNQLTHTVSELTLRHGGRRVTPHPFRDIVAYTWLKEHPKDYLTLSKMLWHSNINTTIQIYGSRFNESNGVSAMESWLDEREANSK